MALPLSAVWASPEISPMSSNDDSDLAGFRRDAIQTPALRLTPDSIREITPNGPLTIRLLRVDHGIETPVEGLIEQIQTGCAAGASRFELNLPLNNRWISITQSSNETYSLIADLPCQGTHALIYHQDTHSGQAVGIWQVAERARRKLEEAVGLRFWNRRIEFSWPDDGDYYSWGTVHLTRGDYWDVVGHEMGHAIYDLGAIGAIGGGQHKIDECYTESLALSEGWASFFSAWVNLKLDDSDARFEYLVPRRAPIRIENIPADVCKGQKNEWRVSGFFWDFVDSHDDGESQTENFARMWRSMAGSRVPSTRAAKDKMVSGGASPDLLAVIWALNLME